MHLTAYADESVRRQTYLFAAILLGAQQRPKLDQVVRSSFMPGQRRLHLRDENDQRRRTIIDALAGCGVFRARIYRLEGVHPDSRVREQCLHGMTNDLAGEGVSRLILDRIEEKQRARDRQTILMVVRKTGAELHYDHAESREHSGLQAADVVAWAFGAGGDWRRRVMPVIEAVIEL